MQLGQDSA